MSARRVPARLGQLDDQNLFGQFYPRWEEIADRHGFPVADERGDLVPKVADAITGLITAAIWFGITTGHHAIACGRYHIPRRLMPYCGSTAGGWGGGSR